MHFHSPLAPLAIACALGLYGWWCLFRTESAIDFMGRFYVGAAGRSINYAMTKLHGVLSFLFASILVFDALKTLLG